MLIRGLLFFVYAAGFVHSDMKGEGRPGMAQVRLAHDMMTKKNLKKTRKIHPLFARGFDTQLRMEVNFLRAPTARRPHKCIEPCPLSLAPPQQARLTTHTRCAASVLRAPRRSPTRACMLPSRKANRMTGRKRA